MGKSTRQAHRFATPQIRRAPPKTPSFFGECRSPLPLSPTQHPMQRRNSEMGYTGYSPKAVEGHRTPKTPSFLECRSPLPLSPTQHPMQRRNSEIGCTGYSPKAVEGTHLCL
jgi:hypothetical protein